jgi:hypothetical protein
MAEQLNQYALSKMLGSNYLIFLPWTSQVPVEFACP